MHSLSAYCESWSIGKGNRPCASMDLEWEHLGLIVYKEFTGCSESTSQLKGFVGLDVFGPVWAFTLLFS